MSLHTLYISTELYEGWTKLQVSSLLLKMILPSDLILGLENSLKPKNAWRRKHRLKPSKRSFLEVV